MTHASSERVSMRQMLVPIVIMAFTMALFFAFQMTQVMTDRDSLNQAFGRQETSFTESQKLNTQFGGLVVGTQKLAQEGNKSAVELEKKLKLIGVIQSPPSTSAQQTAPVPVAMEKKSNGPVKP
ncbi:MAG: hypothetical protein PHD48_10080 [Alphaproteobacteria bacterium]|nr:hypothetical protein [Alphaproteobacteria bacterium]